MNYMGHDQCNRCRFDHICWSLASFLWENGNTPNNCKQFVPIEGAEE